MRKLLILSGKILILLFAILGLCNIGLFIATKFQWTNEAGIIDKNDRYFQEIAKRKKPVIPVNDSLQELYQNNLSEGMVFRQLLSLNNLYPKNAHLIFKVYKQTKDIELARVMLKATSVSLLNSNDSIKAFANDTLKKHSGYAQHWMNSHEWEVLKETLQKEKTSIDSAALVSGVESRLILCCVIGEQLRIYNQLRESFKNYFAPAKKLSFMVNLSYGVTGIKEVTAMQTESHLRDASSVFYLGKEYESLLDFNTDNSVQDERIDRLKNFNDHFYSYLYTALILRQTKTQWEKAGYDISNRPEILATLYNIGFRNSKPKENPSAGGASFIVNNDSCTFGGVAFDFYYSGELSDEFPYSKDKWTDGATTTNLLTNLELKQKDNLKAGRTFAQNQNDSPWENYWKQHDSTESSKAKEEKSAQELKEMEENLKQATDSASKEKLIKLIDRFFDQ